MKKKVSLFFGTIISLIASIFSSATASACGGPGDYIPPKAYKDAKSFKDEKSYYDEKAYYDVKAEPEVETYYDEKSYVETKPSPIVTTLQNGKTTVVLTSYPDKKSYAGSKVSIDGMEMMQTALPKASTAEKQRILRAMNEIGCMVAKNPDVQNSEAKVKAVFKKHGFKTDDKSMEALEAKYANDTAFNNQVRKALESCGGKAY